MDHGSLLMAQLMEVFRIGLIAGLVYTTVRTRQQTGIAIPMLAGVVFVAVILATTMPVPGVEFWRQIASGLAANALIAVALWSIWSAVSRRMSS